MKKLRSVLLSIVTSGLLASSAFAGLLANWNFDAGSLADSSGNGRTLKVDHGSAEYLANGSGNALNASGDSFYYDFGNLAQLNNFTISSWVKTQSGGSGWKNYWTLLSSVEQTGTNNDYAGLRFQSRDASGSVSGVNIYNCGGFAPNAYPVIPNLASVGATFATAWTLPRADYDHFIFTVDGGAAKLYLNGSQVWSGSWTNTDKIGIFSLAGCFNSGGGRDMPGHFDSVSVFNTGLTADEVGLLYAAGSSTSTVFNTEYSRAISGTANWSDAVWTRKITTETGAGTANTAWTDFSSAVLTSSEAATISIASDLNATKIATNDDASKKITLNVADGKTVTAQSVTGAWTKAGNGTLKITGSAGQSGNYPITIEGGVVDASSSSAKLYPNSGYFAGDAVVTVKTGGTLKVNNFVNYGGTFGCLRSENEARVLDGGTIQITGGDQSTANGNAFTVTANGGTLEMVQAGKTTTFTPFKENEGRGNVLNGTLVLTGDGNLTFTARFKGTGGLTKRGSGTVTLASDSNSYSGPTTLEEGNLIISGTVVGETIAKGGILTGTGTLAGLTLKAGSSFSPGTMTEVGAMTAASLATEEGARLVFNVDAANMPDVLTIIGNAQLSEGVIDLVLANPDQEYVSFDVLKADSLSGLADWNLALNSSLRNLVTLNYANGVLTANYNFPEPGAWLLLLLGSGFLFYRKRNLRKVSQTC